MKILAGLLISALLALAAAAVVPNSVALAINLLGSTFSALVSERGANVDSGGAYGPLPRQMLDVYHPSSAPLPGAPIAIFVYGGSWTSGSRGMYGFVGQALARRGITAVIPDYRLYPHVKFPAFNEDVALAYSWTARNLARDCRPIFLVGHSAGAHIAALLAYDSRYLDAASPGAQRPAGFIGLAGPYAFDPTTWETTKDIFSTAPSADAARPVAQVRRGAPPSLFMHGLADNTVKLWNADELLSKLGSAGTEAEFVKLDGIGHMGIVGAIARPLRWRAPVLDKMVAFFERHTAAYSAASRPNCSSASRP